MSKIQVFSGGGGGGGNKSDCTLYITKVPVNKNSEKGVCRFGCSKKYQDSFLLFHKRSGATFYLRISFVVAQGLFYKLKKIAVYLFTLSGAMPVNLGKVTREIFILI